MFRHNSAVGEREELDRECRNLRENVDECTLTRVDLERKLLTLREELEFENMVHSEVVNELKAQLVTDHVRVQVDTHGPDMSELLRDIRSQYEVAAKKNREETEAWYNSKVKNIKILNSVCVALMPSNAIKSTLMVKWFHNQIFAA